MNEPTTKYVIQNPEGNYLVSFLSDTIWSDDSKDASSYNKKNTAEFVISRNPVLKGCIATEIQLDE